MPRNSIFPKPEQKSSGFSLIPATSPLYFLTAHHRPAATHTSPPCTDAFSCTHRRLPSPPRLYLCTHRRPIPSPPLRHKNPPQLLPTRTTHFISPPACNLSAFASARTAASALPATLNTRPTPAPSQTQPLPPLPQNPRAIPFIKIRLRHTQKHPAEFPRRALQQQKRLNFAALTTRTRQRVRRHPSLSSEKSSSDMSL